jgi:hypothetical protein
MRATVMARNYWIARQLAISASSARYLAHQKRSARSGSFEGPPQSVAGPSTCNGTEVGRQASVLSDPWSWSERHPTAMGRRTRQKGRTRLF